MLVGPDQVREILEGALAAAVDGADSEGIFWGGREAVTRFAMNRVHQNVTESDHAASFRVALGARAGGRTGKRIGGARTNGRDPSVLAECARRASAIARAQVEDPDFPGLVKSPPAEDRGLADYDEAAASLSPEERVKAVVPAIEKAKARGLEASGSLTVGSGELALANSLGTFQYHPSTSVRLHVVARTGSVEGAWTESASRWSDIDPGRAASRAVERALASRDPVEVEPGEYVTVLEPDAVADMIDMLAYMGLGATAFLEERSFLCGKVGEKIASDRVTLTDDPFRAGGAVRPFDYEGVPKMKLTLIEKGVARGPVYDTRTAKRARVASSPGKKDTRHGGTESTGHALPEPNPRGPYPLNLVLEPGESPPAGGSALDEMIASTERGILVSRFHYTNPVDPKRTVITGMTRFGTFLIEGGRVTKPVRSMRFTDSVIDALSRVEAVGSDLRRVGDTLAPAVKLSSWRFTGVTGE